MAEGNGLRWRVINTEADSYGRFRLTYLVDEKTRHVVHFPAVSYTSENVHNVGQQLVLLPDWTVSKVYG